MRGAGSMTKHDFLQYCMDTYSTSPDYHFDGDYETAVFRHQDNQKWFALVMGVSRRKFGLDSDEITDVVNLKLPIELFGSFGASQGVYPAYHMNKLHWISVLLNDAPDETVKFLLDVSFEATQTKSKPKIRPTEVLVNQSDFAYDLTIRKIADVAGYLSQIDSMDADWDFYHDVFKNSENIRVICCGDEVVGLSCINEGTDSYIYVYVFPNYRNQGFGYRAVCALEQQLTVSQSISTAYNSNNEIAKKLAEKCGFEKRLSSVVMQYSGEPFELPPLPIRKHRDEDFIEAYTMSAEAFHIMRLETGYFPDSVPFVPDEEIRQQCLETAEERYIYVLGNEIVGCAHIDGAELDNVAIKISHQGKGLGRLFVKYLVNEILQKGIDKPFLYCIDQNKKARQLYNSLGFKEIVCNVYATKRKSSNRRE